MSSASSSKLFQPIKFGDVTLQHRVVMAPLTRFRANERHAHTELGVEYYTQRASVPGTLIITEATFISPQAGGYAHVPGIWSEEQIVAWKKITDAIHAKGSYVVMQLWALGRAADPSQLTSEDPSYTYHSSSDIRLDDRPADSPAPVPLTIPQIQQFIQWYATAASNAVHKAGFDGVEIHGAHGYLIDQFTQDTCNKRTDAYGGSVEGRTRFGLEVVDAVVAAVGAEKVGIRLSPWSPWQGMRMTDPVPTFTHLVQTIKNKHPKFGYIHAVEPRLAGIADRDPTAEESNDFLRKIWGEGLYLAAGGFTREDAINTADTKGGLVVFGRYFISNPDLPRRIRDNIPFTKYDRSTFYVDKPTPKGYTDYAFAEETAGEKKDADAKYPIDGSEAKYSA
ncbi:FMN-linked oxidoreductase [Stereum hirsutum FP-91666 SS1]|uniref:FMN-linked oxidoreductase n=1 Tax=Stereum hirsutum (strain FP-91666) TaxID=721885 RepID=R7RWC5_STEHR|nr:FMN-linked oxidoreductase [Stereum hirsutum FP-91666 SS1]EIM79599.1 FMN-linked oxidoreductase [Stereum hirsutum FP-91666 SS1]